MNDEIDKNTNSDIEVNQVEDATSSKEKMINKGRKHNTKIILMIILFLGVLLIVSTYAWFSASLNVKIRFISMKVASDRGLFISLDGINYTDEVEINTSSIIYDLKRTYPNHTNQWALGGLWTVSSNGIKTPNDDKFDIYAGLLNKYKTVDRRGERYLKTARSDESKPNVVNQFISFDIFLKNVSGSPKPDNLYLTENTYFDFQDDVEEDIRADMTGIMNSLRLGFVRIGETNLTATPEVVQNLKCNNGCSSYIYEPFSKNHTAKSIEDAKEYGLTIEDGQFYPTYGVYNEGTFLDHKSGYMGGSTPLDTAHFALQETRTDEDLNKPLFKVPNGVVKVRVYIWLEGQDVDSLESHSKGAPIKLSIDLEKDLAGYEGF